ncbi:MAG: cyclase family protein [Erysipelotrichaceae bacterium]
MLYDISPRIHHEMSVYKNKDEKRPVLHATTTTDPNYSYESMLSLPLHTGAHVDAPLHMVEQGKTIDQIPLERFYGKAYVVDVTGVRGALLPEHVNQIEHWGELDYILFKTDNSSNPEFDPDFVYVGSELAALLAHHDLKGVGIDALGIERNDPFHHTHKYLLDAGVVILEGLQLAKIREQRYWLFCFPLLIVGAEASPVRAVLMDLDSFLDPKSN